MIENSKEMLSTWRWGNRTGVSSRPKRRCWNSASVSSRSKRRLMYEHNSGQIWFNMPDSLFWLLRQWCFVKMRCWFWAAFIFINLKKSESKNELGLELRTQPYSTLSAHLFRLWTRRGRELGHSLYPIKVITLQGLVHLAAGLPVLPWHREFL